jgi:hypothetical protein
MNDPEVREGKTAAEWGAELSALQDAGAAAWRKYNEAEEELDRCANRSRVLIPQIVAMGLACAHGVWMFDRKDLYL